MQRSWILSWAMSHIGANHEYRSQIDATNRLENIVPPRINPSIKWSTF
jgi:hypothetical protein